MYVEIFAFILTTSGWILVTSTIPTDYWKISSLEETVITTNTYWSNLWKMCVTDFTGVSDCKDFPSLLALDGYLQVCRALMITAVCLGFFGSIFALIGMKCTKIGGSDRIKARIACSAGITFILSGLSSISSCSLYAHEITSEFFDPLFVDLKYDMGAALFIGWGGSVLLIAGGCVFCFSVACSIGKSQRQRMYKGNVSYVPSFLMGQVTTGHQRPAPQKGNPPRKQHFEKNEYV